jgi:hypothetical protein
VRSTGAHRKTLVRFLSVSQQQFKAVGDRRVGLREEVAAVERESNGGMACATGDVGRVRSRCDPQCNVSCGRRGVRRASATALFQNRRRQRDKQGTGRVASRAISPSTRCRR